VTAPEVARSRGMTSYPQRPVPVPADPSAFQAVDRFVRATARVRRLDLVRARALREMQASKIYLLEGCASLVELASRHGVRPWVACDLLALAALLERRPDLEPRFLDGDLSLRAAATLERVLELPGEPVQPWIDLALDLGTRDFCSEVKDRLAERRVGRPPVHLHLRISATGHDDLCRARVLVQRKSPTAITLDEAAEACFGEYLERNDPQRVVGRARRMPDTHGRPGRTVPRRVAREVRHRDRERCIVPACPNEVFLHLGHLESHARGGSRETDNLFVVCPRHNQMMEDGLLIVKGTVQSPSFFDQQGRPYREGTRPRRRAPPRRPQAMREGHAPGEPPRDDPPPEGASANQQPET
jgi:hypothetical protein